MVVEACPWKIPDVLAAEAEACLEKGFFTASAAQAPCKNHQNREKEGRHYYFWQLFIQYLFVHRKNYEKNDLLNVDAMPLHHNNLR